MNGANEIERLDEAAATIDERIYAACLYLYPLGFRREYASALRQSFRDRRREAGGASARFWAEMARDFLHSAASEHFSALLEGNPMRVAMLLFLVLLGGVVLFRMDAISIGLDDRYQAWQDARQAKRDREYDRQSQDYTFAIAEKLAASPDARAQLTAAQFYRPGGDGSLRKGERPTGAAQDFQQRQAMADKAFANALRSGWDDPVILMAAAAHCPATRAICRGKQAMAHLTDIAPDNAAVWRAQFTYAVAAKDTEGERAAIARMAQASTFDIYERENLHAWLDAYAAVTVPAQLTRIEPYIATANQVIADQTESRLWSLEIATSNQDFALQQLCGNAKGELRNQCRLVAARLSAADVDIARDSGLRLSLELADNDAERAAVQWRLRAIHWQQQSYWNLLHDNALPEDFPAPYDEARTTHWLGDLRQRGNLMLAREQSLQRADIPLTPSADWRG